ncbi:MAG TPA: TonB family protein, partial [Candidatus Eisenbacteria bacterium]|nr:TonB family protein [Candidatus Eisenbacteria bacterium]
PPRATAPKNPAPKERNAPAAPAKRRAPAPAASKPLREPEPRLAREAKPPAAPDPVPQSERKPEEPVREAPTPRSETSILAERELPTVQEMLPPLTWSRSPRANREGPIRLDTKNPRYVTYFGSIKRDIELVWEYPEQALRYGLQGKLLLEFSILSNGQLESARIVRSSGSHLLDYEALRAVRAAAPFKPIPPWIEKDRIEILASFEYLDNRLNYRFLP